MRCLFIGDNVLLSIFRRSLPKNWLIRWALYYFKIRYHRVSSQGMWKPACFHRNPDKSDRSLIEIYVLYNLPFLHHAICITATISWKRLCICFVTHKMKNALIMRTVVSHLKGTSNSTKR